MSDEQLIDEIVRQVVQRLGGAPAPGAEAPPAKTGAGDPPAGPAVAPAADSAPQPPACEASPLPLPNVMPPSDRPKRKVFLTADELRLRAGADGRVALAPDEWLTPNAQDYADQRKLRLERVCPAQPAASPAAGPRGQTILPATEAVGVVAHAADAKVASALTALGREGLGMPRFDATDCWMRNSSAMLKAILAGQLGGGVILVPSGEAAIVFANKYRGIRAVLGVRTDGVADAVRGFDANVLVVEHGHRSFYEMRTLIQTFIALRRQARPATAMLQTLTSLEGRP